MKFVIVIFALLSLLGCQNTPTKVYETVPVKPKQDAMIGDIVITEKTVIVDARPAFDYTIAHINGSIALRPEDFTQRDYPMMGQLEKDYFALTRYLARKGIAQDTPVIVVGRGKSGQGEEGRVAWTLKFLGVKDVQFLPIDRFSMPLTNAEAPPKESEVIWMPEINDSLSIDRDNVKRVIKSIRNREPAWVVIDVRSEDEYLGKVKGIVKKNIPDIGAINIPWTEFFLEDGKINASIKDKLKAIEITDDRYILILSNQGQRSAATLLAMKSMGFNKATHFPGGYLELVETGLK